MIIKILAIFFFVALQLSAMQGYIVNVNNIPITSALVRLQNTNLYTRSDDTGHYQLISTHFNGYITASKTGYLIGGMPYDGKKDANITLKKLPIKDNTHYLFTPSLVQNILHKNTHKAQKTCQHCHTKISDAWKQDAHANTLKNHNFLSMYTHGFKKDFPQSDGNCAQCHAPLMALKKRANMTTPTPAEKEGISCDLCHKVKDISLNNPSLNGTQRMHFVRPFEEEEILLGSMNDVYPRFDAYSSLYTQSRFCAGCHDGSFWGKKVYSEYEEWKNSTYATKNITCQNCHMPTSSSKQYIADQDKKGFLREGLEFHSHTMRGVNDTDFMKSALTLTQHTHIIKHKLYLDINITNTGAGHHVPTGSPFRYLLLEISTDNNITQLSSLYIPTWARNKKAHGKVYAKVFKSASGYGQNIWTKNYPEHFWRPITLSYDTRIPAHKSDFTSFIFDIKKLNTIHLNIKLTYFKFNNDLINKLGVKQKKVILYNKKITIGR